MLALLPFICLWRIIREVLEVQPDFSQATGIVRNGWMAVLFAVLAWLVYVAALVCSQGSAFRTAANMKKALMRHIARLPIGFADEIGSGKVRWIVTEVTGSTETLLAHNLPDMAGAIAMPVCMVVMLFVFDWRYGIACLISILFQAMPRYPSLHPARRPLSETCVILESIFILQSISTSCESALRLLQ